MFLALGAMIGQAGPNMLDVGVDSPILPVVSTLSLVLVLFTDAVSLDDGSPVQRPRRSANTFGHRMLPFGSSSLGWQPYLLTRPGSRWKSGRCGLAASSLAGQNGKCSRSDNAQGSPDVRAQPPRKRLPEPVP